MDGLGRLSIEGVLASQVHRRGAPRSRCLGARLAVIGTSFTVIAAALAGLGLFAGREDAARRRIGAALLIGLLLMAFAQPALAWTRAPGVHANASVARGPDRLGAASLSTSLVKALPGPPYPPPVAGQDVYDYAGIFSTMTISKIEAAIQAIASRTKAEIVVFTQLKPGATTGSTRQDAAALMGQWEIGGTGNEDGLVVLWNVDETLVQGPRVSRWSQ